MQDFQGHEWRCYPNYLAVISQSVRIPRHKEILCLRALRKYCFSFFVWDRSLFFTERVPLHHFESSWYMCVIKIKTYTICACNFYLLFFSSPTIVRMLYQCLTTAHERFPFTSLEHRRNHGCSSLCWLQPAAWGSSWCAASQPSGSASSQ